MKKMIVSLCLLVAMSLCFTGCITGGGGNTSNEAIARQLGMTAAVTWIAVDNPSTNDVETAKKVVSYVRYAATNEVATNTSYYATLYPYADKYIRENLNPSQQPAARLGAAWMLTQLDIIVVTRPKWFEKDEDKAIIVDAFCVGFLMGLDMAPTEPAVVAVKQQSGVRIKIKE
jgi:hypothetical protein